MKITMTPEQWEAVLSKTNTSSIGDFSVSGFSGDIDIDDALSSSDIDSPFMVRGQNIDSHSRIKKDKTPTKVEGEIIVSKANNKHATGTYGGVAWKANKDSEGSWKISSKATLSNGQKSSVSAKINQYLRGE
jgi:hypothetical protein